MSKISILLMLLILFSCTLKRNQKTVCVSNNYTIVLNKKPIFCDSIEGKGLLSLKFKINDKDSIENVKIMNMRIKTNKGFRIINNKYLEEYFLKNYFDNDNIKVLSLYETDNPQQNQVFNIPFYLKICK